MPSALFGYFHDKLSKIIPYLYINVGVHDPNAVEDLIYKIPVFSPLTLRAYPEDSADDIYIKLLVGSNSFCEILEITRFCHIKVHFLLYT